MKKFHIQTLGCKVNQYESDGIGSTLENSGWIKGGKNEICDVFIVNTCAVTSKASMQSRQAIRKIMRENPKARVIVTGCHAQTDPEEIKKIDPFIDHADKTVAEQIHTPINKSIHEPIHKGHPIHIIGHQDKTKIADNIDLICDNKASIKFKNTNFSDSNTFKGFDHAVKGSMTRAYLKIQDGCEAFCTYCIVPFARGSYVSMPESKVLKHLRELNGSGFKEVILTGIHTGMYGVDFKNKTTLFKLLEKINIKKPVHRIRLSSIEPGEINEDIINLATKENILCDHFHVPLQSGDSDILKKMKRPYDADLFENIIWKINKKLPFAGIGVDTLIGFPGETQKQFENTYNLIEKLPVSYLHVFPFSARKGTPAFHFAKKVDPSIIKERCSQMRKLDQIKRKKFIKKNVNQKLEALVQHKSDKQSGMLKSVTSNYLNVFLNKRDNLKGKIINLKIQIDQYNRKSKMPVTGKVIE
jgi:threonylcarbamoyladenosine tRNA methylthiotransferase MtaB